MMLNMASVHNIIFDNSILGEGEFEPWKFPLETLGGANQLSYKALSLCITSYD